jgi:hypothetical protein
VQRPSYEFKLSVSGARNERSAPTSETSRSTWFIQWGRPKWSRRRWTVTVIGSAFSVCEIEAGHLPAPLLADGALRTNAESLLRRSAPLVLQGRNGDQGLTDVSCSPSGDQEMSRFMALRTSTAEFNAAPSFAFAD